jgi:calcineurin-like phosphoesterase family protein
MKFKARDTQNMWFTADYHLFHKNIIQYDDRPFASLDEMAETIIANHNKFVAPGDIVFNLGDFSLGSVTDTLGVLARLNGQHHLIKGNHESTVLGSKTLRETFSSVDDYLELQIDLEERYPHLLCLFHYPIHEWNSAHYGSWMLHGHTHGDDDYLDRNNKIINVGIMLNGYFPISYWQIAEYMTWRTNKAHH